VEETSRVGVRLLLSGIESITEVTGCVLDDRDSFPTWALQFFSGIRPASHPLAIAGPFAVK
jgi:hypothetical protein